MARQDSVQSAPRTERRTPDPERGLLLSAISNAVVRIHKQFLGRGPVKARSHLSGDVLTVILEGGFLQGERTLHEHGHAREVINSRLAMQETMEQEFRVAIESILYRSVRSFMSGSDPENDLQAEIFVLEPETGEQAGLEADSVAGGS
jgi:uncharacterized protein YbcI